jgi:hypothetical protein
MQHSLEIVLILLMGVPVVPVVVMHSHILSLIQGVVLEFLMRFAYRVLDER